MSWIMADVKWKERVCMLLTLSLCSSPLFAAPQHSHPRNHFRITISAEDTGEVSSESLRSYPSRQGPGVGHRGSPMQRTHTWMHYGNSDSSEIGKPVSRQLFTSRERFEPESREVVNSVGLSNTFSSEVEDNLSVENYSNEYDEDIKIMTRGYGRRYHPVGVPLQNTPLFIPESVAPQIAAGSSVKNTVVNAPQHFVVLDESGEIESAEIQNRYDDFDDSREIVVPHTTMYNQKTGRQRSMVDEDALKSRYNFIDTQGSVNWGYTLDDQFQKQVVHNDGSMDGEYGWDTPDGSKVHVKYVAGKNGFRVVSSFGVHPEYSDDVKKMRENHFEAHQNAISGPYRQNLDNDEVMVHLPGVGVPLPGAGYAGPLNPSGAAPSFGVPMPSPNENIGPVGSGNTATFGNNFGIGLPEGELHAGNQPSINGNFDSTMNIGNVGISLDEVNQNVQNQGSNFGPVGVPMPNPNEPINFGPEQPTGNIPNFGVPIDQPGLFPAGNTPNLNAGQQPGNVPNFGVPVENSGPQTGNVPNFGVPIDQAGSFPTTNNPDLGVGPQLPGNVPNFGVPIEDAGSFPNTNNPNLNAGPQPPVGVPNFGVPIEDAGAFPNTNIPNENSNPNPQGFPSAPGPSENTPFLGSSTDSNPQFPSNNPIPTQGFPGGPEFPINEAPFNPEPRPDVVIDPFADLGFPGSQNPDPSNDGFPGAQNPQLNPFPSNDGFPVAQDPQLNPFPSNDGFPGAETPQLNPFPSNDGFPGAQDPQLNPFPSNDGFPGAENPQLNPFPSNDGFPGAQNPQLNPFPTNDGFPEAQDPFPSNDGFPGVPNPGVNSFPSNNDFQDPNQQFPGLSNTGNPALSQSAPIGALDNSLFPENAGASIPRSLDGIFAEGLSGTNPAAPEPSLAVNDPVEGLDNLFLGSPSEPTGNSPQVFPAVR